MDYRNRVEISNRILQILLNNGAKVKSINFQELSLEEAFMKIIGDRSDQT